MALLRLGVDPTVAPGRALILSLNASAFVVPQHPRLYIDVVVNGQTIDQWIFRSAFRPGWRRELKIPAAVRAGRRGLDIEFRFRNPEAPLYLGSGPSSNFLGLNVREIVLHPE